MIRLAKHGFVDCIEFCLSLFRSDYKEDKPETDYLLNSEIYIPIIKSNLNTKEKIKAMEKLQDLGFPPCHTAYIIDRNTESNPACLVWLVKNGAQVDSSTLKEAITNGLENTIRFLLGIGVPLTAEVMEHACSENKIKVVKMFMERDCPCDRNSFFRAIENSNLEMVKILLSYIPCEANEEVIEKTIEFGNVECLKYLHRNGVSWEKGAYKLLDLIREEGHFTKNHEACMMYLKCFRK